MKVGSPLTECCLRKYYYGWALIPRVYHYDKLFSGTIFCGAPASPEAGPDMDKLNSIFELRDMLRQLETDMGLGGLSRTERDVLLAAHSLSAGPDHIVTSNDLRDHRLVRLVPQATFYRAVRTLLGRGFLERAGDTRARAYVVRSDLVGPALPEAPA